MQRNSFTLNQLQYASEICDLENFTTTFNKAAEGTTLHGLGGIYARDCKHRKRTLLDWIFELTRPDRDGEIGLIINKMLVELIGNFRGE